MRSHELKSLKKALDLIELIADAGTIGVREMADRAGFPPATAHRIAATLLQRGYLQQNLADRRYALSTRFLELADCVQRRFDIVSLARPHLEALSGRTRENANLCVLDGMDVVYIYQVRSREHALQSFTRLGARAPLFATGVGKVFLSHMTPSEIDAYLKEVELVRHTGNTITQRTALRDELARVRKRGYSVDNQEKEQGVRCVAAPVLGHTNRVVAAISVSGASQRITMDRVHLLGPVVIEQASKISADLGYPVNSRHGAAPGTRAG